MGEEVVVNDPICCWLPPMGGNLDPGCQDDHPSSVVVPAPGLASPSSLSHLCRYSPISNPF